MSAHTPGPWSVGGSTGYLNQVAIEPSIGCTYGKTDALANARLIAAAPDLARELNQAAALLAIAALTVRTVDFEGERFDLLAEAERFDALLAKATGGPA